jgi:membrane-anchored mycosin MYCP
MRATSSFVLVLAAWISGCGEDPPAAASTCALDQCGITCFDADACGACGNSVCDWHESLSVCPVDCCDAALCDPSAGDRFTGGDAMCSGAPDGTLCEDGDPANGAETCRGGVCRHEHAHCRCAPQGGIYADHLPEELPDEPPSTPADPPWTGPEPVEDVFAAAWGHRRTDVSRAWMRTRGDPSVRVGIVDTGCDETLADFSGRVIATRDFTTGDPESTVGDHGTHLASIVAADDDGTATVGVAPGVSLVCARVLRGDDDRGATADPALVAAGIDWVVEQGASVVLVGLAGHGSTTPELERAVAAAIAADVVVVAPSGSQGGGSVDAFPAALPGVISVGASDLADLHDVDSDLAATTLLIAPGKNVVGDYAAGGIGGETGSSPAAAYVAGAAALVRSAEPTLSAPAVRALLHRWADPVPMPEWEDFFVARRLDIGEVVTRASPTLVDVAVSDASFLAESALPGATLPVRVRVENRGVVDASGVRVQIAVTGGTAMAGEQTIAALGLGASEELLFDVVPSGSATEISVTATATLTGDVEPADDEATATVPITAEVQHRLRVRRLWMDAPSGDTRERTVRLVVENAGNVAEPAGEVRVAPYPLVEVSGRSISTPALAPGETAELETTVELAEDTPDGRHVIAAWLLPARGQRDLSASSATLQLTWRAGHPELSLAYMQHKGFAIIFDAPWRTIRDQIPVMVYYARTAWLGTQGPDGYDLIELLPVGERNGALALFPKSPPGRVEIDRVTIANPRTPGGEEPLIYDDERQTFFQGNGTPDLVPAGAFATDEFHARITSRKLVVRYPTLG